MGLLVIYVCMMEVVICMSYAEVKGCLDDIVLDMRRYFGEIIAQCIRRCNFSESQSNLGWVNPF